MKVMEGSLSHLKAAWIKYVAWRFSYFRKQRAARKYLKNYNEILQAKTSKPLEKFIFKQGYEISFVDEDTALHVFCDIFMNECYRLEANQDGGCIVDLGANAGFFSTYAHLKRPNARIFAVEASPVTAKVLERNINDNHLGESIKTFHMAISDKQGKVPFFISGISGWSSTYQERGAQDGREVLVDAMRFSDFCRQQNIKCVDYLKIDVEGAEYAIILGDPSFFDVPVLNMVIEVDKSPRDPRWTFDNMLTKLKTHYDDVGFLHTSDQNYPLIQCRKLKIND